ncbi:hypothetical protein F4802DRAFT_129044 [Xylaria palmicola]|nr:hypothetical protein F4802DRAFT_129044 [Xylaria palmicola]
MAFAAVRFPLDKDQGQLSFWPDNDELAIPSDNFFEQFVTFDGGDAAAAAASGGDTLQDPPSPSILLESLQNELTTSFSAGPLDFISDRAHVETPDITASQPIAISPRTTPDLAEPHPMILGSAAKDPVLSSGSISDTELLHLEGISLKSSPRRGNVTAPSSPTLSPRKHSRFAESVYATVRRTLHRARPVKKQQHYQPVDMTGVETFLKDTKLELDDLGVSFDDLPDPVVGIKREEPTDARGLPLSPPLTGRIPNEHHHQTTSVSGFVSGCLDDPFCGDGVLLGAPATIHHPAAAKHRGGVDTPMDTPAMSGGGDAFFHGHQVISLRDVELGACCPPQKTFRGGAASSAEWPMEGLLTEAAQYGQDGSMWTAASPSAVYLIDGGGGGGMMHDNAAHNMAVHSHHQADLPYEYSSGADDVISGLNIHMPQPRTPQAGVLGSRLNQQHGLEPPGYHHMQGTPRAQTHQHFLPQQPRSAHKGHGHGHGQHAERRPRPRAPSSGARHHHHGGPPQTSPRKLRHSVSMEYLREEESPSSHPHSQQQGRHASNAERRQQRSSSLTMRKQRSFTRRSGQQQQQSHHNHNNHNNHDAHNHHHQHEPRTPGGGRSSFRSTSSDSGGHGGRGGGGFGGGGGLSFKNFTADDKDQLMAGVAPSGSSKTKARREKEAQEKTKKLSEAALKAAGGDLDPDLFKKLMREFEFAS